MPDGETAETGTGQFKSKSLIDKRCTLVGMHSSLCTAEACVPSNVGTDCIIPSNLFKRSGRPSMGHYLDVLSLLVGPISETCSRIIRRDLLHYSRQTTTHVPCRLCPLPPLAF